MLSLEEGILKSRYIKRLYEVEKEEIQEVLGGEIGVAYEKILFHEINQLETIESWIRDFLHVTI